MLKKPVPGYFNKNSESVDAAAGDSIANDALADTSATQVTMPFVEDALRVANRLKTDLWSYGEARNQMVLEAFLLAHHEQGLPPSKLDLSEFFHLE